MHRKYANTVLRKFLNRHPLVTLRKRYSHQDAVAVIKNFTNFENVEPGPVLLNSPFWTEAKPIIVNHFIPVLRSGNEQITLQLFTQLINELRRVFIRMIPMSAKSYNNQVFIWVDINVLVKYPFGMKGSCSFTHTVLT